MDKEFKGKVWESAKWLASFIILVFVWILIHNLIDINPYAMGLILIGFFILVYYIYRKWKK